MSALGPFGPPAGVTPTPPRRAGSTTSSGDRSTRSGSRSTPCHHVRPGTSWFGAGRRLLRNPTDFFAGTRADLGDTFVADVFGYRLVCLFSPAGVRAPTPFPEDQASFALATFSLDPPEAPRRPVPRAAQHTARPLRQPGRHPLSGQPRAAAAPSSSTSSARTARSRPSPSRSAWPTGSASLRGCARRRPPLERPRAPARAVRGTDAAESFVRPALWRSRPCGRAYRRGAVAGHWPRSRPSSPTSGPNVRLRGGFRDDMPRTGGGRLRRLITSPPRRRAPGRARDLVVIPTSVRSRTSSPALAWTIIDLLAPSRARGGRGRW